jgi:hypothetical protein
LAYRSQMKNRRGDLVQDVARSDTASIKYSAVVVTQQTCITRESACNNKDTITLAMSLTYSTWSSLFRSSKLVLQQSLKTIKGLTSLQRKFIAQTRRYTLTVTTSRFAPGQPRITFSTNSLMMKLNKLRVSKSRECCPQLLSITKRTQAEDQSSPCQLRPMTEFTVQMMISMKQSLFKKNSHLHLPSRITFRRCLEINSLTNE